MVWKTATSIFTAALLYGGSIENASAAVIIDAQETGGNVVFSFSGTLDIGGLSLVLSDPGGSPSGAINPFDISFRSLTNMTALARVGLART